MWQKIKKLFRSRKVLFTHKGYDVYGVTLGWSGRPTILFESSGEKIFPREIEIITFGDLYTEGEEWPRHPITNEELPIAH